MNGTIKVSSDVLPKVRKTSRTTRSTANQSITTFNISKCRTLSYQRSYYIRTTRIWNELAHKLELSLSMNVNTLKTKLKEYYTIALNKCYNPEDPRSWKTICPSCNKSRPLTIALSCCF